MLDRQVDAYSQNVNAGVGLEVDARGEPTRVSDINGL